MNKTTTAERLEQALELIREASGKLRHDPGCRSVVPMTVRAMHARPGERASDPYPCDCLLARCRAFVNRTDTHLKELADLADSGPRPMLLCDRHFDINEGLPCPLPAFRIEDDACELCNAGRAGECFEDNMTDAEADAATLASAGMGTDEDYGDFGADDDFGF